MTVYDSLAQVDQAVTDERMSGDADFEEWQGKDPETLVLWLIKRDPFLSISELKTEVNRRSPDAKVGWWGVFSILRKNGLRTRRSRFRFARGRR
jgi:hypothetical protein